MDGALLQIGTSRQLSKRCQGELTWVVGPQDSRGMILAVSRRGERLFLLGRLEVRSGCLGDVGSACSQYIPQAQHGQLPVQ